LQENQINLSEFKMPTSGFSRIFGS